MDAFGVLCGLRHNKIFEYKPMLISFILFCACIVWVKQEFYLMLNKMKTKRSITFIFSHLFTFMPKHNT